MPKQLYTSTIFPNTICEHTIVLELDDEGETADLIIDDTRRYTLVPAWLKTEQDLQRLLLNETLAVYNATVNMLRSLAK